MRELALFAGAGGGLLASRELGWHTVCAVEQHAYAASVLVSRQNDGALEPFPIWNDVLTFDGRPWRGFVDIISGGFPCQDVSVTNRYAQGISGSKSGLWKQFARIVGEVRPRYVFIENGPALARRGLDVVLSDLASMGFNAEWGVLGAEDVGAPHERERLWILAYTQVQNLSVESRLQEAEPVQLGGDCRSSRRSVGWLAEPPVDRVVDGVAFRMDRLHVLGNGQVPSCAAEAFRRLHARIPYSMLCI